MVKKLFIVRLSGWIVQPKKTKIINKINFQKVKYFNACQLKINFEIKKIFFFRQEFYNIFIFLELFEEKYNLIIIASNIKAINGIYYMSEFSTSFFSWKIYSSHYRDEIVGVQY